MRAAQASGHGRGRPRLLLDHVQVFELALLGLSNRQIAAQLGCDHKTFVPLRPDLELARCADALCCSGTRCA